MKQHAQALGFAYMGHLTQSLLGTVRLMNVAPWLALPLGGVCSFFCMCIFRFHRETRRLLRTARFSDPVSTQQTKKTSQGTQNSNTWAAVAFVRVCHGPTAAVQWLCSLGLQLVHPPECVPLQPRSVPRLRCVHAHALLRPDSLLPLPATLFARVPVLRPPRLRPDALQSVVCGLRRHPCMPRLPPTPRSAVCVRTVQRHAAALHSVLALPQAPVPGLRASLRPLRSCAARCPHRLTATAPAVCSSSILACANSSGCRVAIGAVRARRPCVPHACFIAWSAATQPARNAGSHASVAARVVL